MNNKINDGGQAFPTSDTVVNKQGDVQHVAVIEGMSLRDYFAAKALGGLCANPNLIDGVTEMDGLSVLTKASYNLADAMIKARDKE